MTEARVRFAPSPTGNLHIGGARTALFNYLFARRNAGKFLLRIEDTDQARSRREYVLSILEGLRFLQLQWNEPPVYQSQNLASHRLAAQKLLKSNLAYPCFCPPEKLEIQRKIAGQEKRDSKYPGYCRNLTPDQIAAKMKSNTPFALRFKVTDELVQYHDLIHGEVKVKGEEIEDFVILRRDGLPTYMLAAVVDDIDMRISHIIRGDDHISNTPKQILLHRALGNVPPQFAHIPLILGLDKQRLSKRHGAKSVLEYRLQGILSTALTNYLAFLGWNPGDEREIMSLDEIIPAFSLDKVNPKSAVFDPEKLEWINGKHISASDDEFLAQEFLNWLPFAPAQPAFELNDNEYIKKVFSLAKSRIHYLNDIITEDDYYFQDPSVYDETGVNTHLRLERLSHKLEVLMHYFNRCNPFTAAKLEQILRLQAEQWDLSAGKLIHPLRLALTGKTSSPGLFQLMEVLGKDTCLRRLQAMLMFLNNL